MFGSPTAVITSKLLKTADITIIEIWYYSHKINASKGQPKCL